MQTHYQPPKLCKKACLITDDPVLGAIVSSYFNKRNEYFCVLEAPRIHRPDGINEVGKCNNAIARLQPDKIILSNLDKKALIALREILPHSRLLEINTPQEAEAILPPLILNQFQGYLTCREDEIAYGLILAKEKNKKLKIDSRAPSLFENYKAEFSSRKHLVFLDNNQLVVPIIAANYAFCINAILEIKNIEEIGTQFEISSRIFESRGLRDLTERTVASNTVSDFKERLRPLLSIDGYEFVSFITAGIPYGYFYPEVPSTHLFSYPGLGISIFIEIFFHLYENLIAAAIVLDPGFFDDCETQEVIDWLQFNAVPTIKLLGEKATVYNVENYLQFFPYDLLFICTHGGETEGERVRVNWRDSNNLWHVFEFDCVFQFAVPSGKITDQTLIKVQRFIKPLTYDGVAWSEAIPEKGFFMKFLHVPENKWDVIERKKIKYVPDAFSISLKDGHSMFVFHTLAAQGHPLIINNGCWTFHEISKNIFFAGARAYVGTLFPIENQKAKEFALRLLREANGYKSLPTLLWEIQKELYPFENERPYVHIGCHFSNIPLPRMQLLQNLIKRFEFAKKSWMRKLEEDIPSDVKENTKRIIEFQSKVDIWELL